MKRALISVTNKEGIVDFAKEHPVAAGICAAVAGALYILSGAGN